ncbi:MAG: hypothetical protein AMXMBFR4_18120 [Candidatus Hydrogenedentota bacterium]
MVPHVFAMHPGGTKIPFFCCAPAGGVVFPCYHLLKYWDPERPFYAIQEPSLNPQQPLYRSVEDLAKDNVAAMREVQPKGPYLLAGWSFGAMVALEMAQQLVRDGERVALLAILDMRVNGPGRKSPFANMKPRQMAIAVPKLILTVFSYTGPYFRDGIYIMFTNVARGDTGASWPVRKLCAGINAFFGRAPVVDVIEANPHLDGISTPTLFRCLRVLWNNIAIMRKYSPQPVRAPIVLLKAANNAELGLHDDDPAMGWGEIAQEGLEVVDVPGNHVVIMLHPSIEVLAERLLRSLDYATAAECPAVR